MRCAVVPLGLSGQAPACPAAPGIGLEPAQMAGGLRQIEGNPLAVAPLLPGAIGAAQVARTRHLAVPGKRVQPGTACFAPPLRLCVTTGIHKGQVLTPTHDLRIHLECAQRNIQRSVLIVESKSCCGAGCNAQAVHGCWQPQRFAGSGQHRRPSRAMRRCDPQGLGHVKRSLVMHVFVMQGEPEKIQLVVAGGHSIQQIQRALQLGSKVGARGCGIRQRQAPAAGMRHKTGVVQIIGLRSDCAIAWGLRIRPHTERALQVARQPEFLKPANVPQLPQGRIDRGAEGHLQVWQCRFVMRKHSQGVLAAVRQRLAQLAHAGVAGHGGGLLRVCRCYAHLVQKIPLIIVTPALADANNGNWQTAQRWARMLGGAYRVHLASEWRQEGPHTDARLMIALHARRSASSIAAWHAAHADRPVLVALTGTDLYRDIQHDHAAQQSLELADALLVLNELGPLSLPPALRSKCHVVLQSCAARVTLPKTPRHLRAVMVGHLREEKDPRTLFAAVELLAARSDIFFDHIGSALDPALGELAMALAARNARYRWLGALPHAQARRRIQAAHILVHPSRMEGGAHVVMEAIRSGTPVIASRIDGNVGLLGAGYGGYFAPGDSSALAALVAGVRDNVAMQDQLRLQVLERSALFAPEREASALQSLVTQLLQRAKA
jgi:putative glycosyltransferase (TIGR04348 family)